MHPTLCDHVTELVSNAIEAGASVVCVDLSEDGDGGMELMIADNACGLPAEFRSDPGNPFAAASTKHRSRVMALGLAGWRQLMEQIGGRWEVRSEPGRGTSIWARWDSRHVDAPPLGDWPSTVAMWMAREGDYELRITRRRGDRGYGVSRRELAEVLGSLSEAWALDAIRRWVEARDADLGIGRLKGVDHGTNDVGGVAAAP